MERMLPMPSKSKAQANLMRAAAHDRGFAKKVGVPQSVAREFVHADQNKSKARRSRSKIGSRPS